MNASRLSGGRYRDIFTSFTLLLLSFEPGRAGTLVDGKHMTSSASISDKLGECGCGTLVDITRVRVARVRWVIQFLFSV